MVRWAGLAHHRRLWHTGFALSSNPEPETAQGEPIVAAPDGTLDEGTQPAETRSYVISSVDRALTILEILSDHPHIGVTEIAVRLGGTKSLAFRLLRTLEARGYVTQDPDRRSYSLGFHAVRIGNGAASQSDLINSTAPLMDELAALSRENVNLLIRDQKKVVIVAARQSKQQVRLHLDIGSIGPLHAGGAANVLLAYAPDDIRDSVLLEPMQQFTNATVIDPDALSAILETIRCDGLHVACNQYEESAFSVAAPVFGKHGVCLAALSVTGPLSRFNDAVEANLKSVVASYASRMSQMLGHTNAA